MRLICATNQFKRDLKKHHLQLVSQEWVEVLHCLIHAQSLPIKYKDHALTGNLADCRDCHIKPDLVLLYRLDGNELQLIRLGSHSELKLA